jgi:hypothetical protein
MTVVPRCVFVKGFNGCDVLVTDRLAAGDVCVVVLSERGFAMRVSDGRAAGAGLSVSMFFSGYGDGRAEVLLIGGAGRGRYALPDVQLARIELVVHPHASSCDVVGVELETPGSVAVDADGCVYAVAADHGLACEWPSAYVRLHGCGHTKDNDELLPSPEYHDMCPLRYGDGYRPPLTLEEGAIRFPKVRIDLTTVREAIRRHRDACSRAGSCGLEACVDESAAELLEALLSDGPNGGGTRRPDGCRDYLFLHEFTFARNCTATLPRATRHTYTPVAEPGAPARVVSRSRRVKPSPRWLRYWRPYVAGAVERLQAFCMGTHPRLGARSAVRGLPADAVEKICGAAAGASAPARPRAAPVTWADRQAADALVVMLHEISLLEDE